MSGTLTPPRTFLGVNFALFGFDPDTYRKVRDKLVSNGGTDAGQYGSSCTHVIVDKIVHDDPLCVSARKDGKTVVNGLWVDHSCDIGMAADTNLVLYRPLRDLNGIPGAKNMIMCLTGYQRQDREDIMNMVAFMGSQFSKPLVANKVTHLICYKFEGEKYELAKKMKKIKLVNHQWLEDCLRVWQILPEADYSKSTYQLETEAEAKDSEDEDQPENNSRVKVINRSPNNMRVGTITPCALLKSSKELADRTAAQEIPNVVAAMDLKATIPIIELREVPVPCSDMVTSSGAISADPHVECEKTPAIEKGLRCYSRKGSLSMQNRDKSSRGINEVDGEQAREGISFASIHNPTLVSHVQMSGSTSALQQKRKMEASPATSKCLKLSSHSTASNSSPFLESKRSEGSKVCNLMDELLIGNSLNPGKHEHKVKELNKDGVLESATLYASYETSSAASLPNAIDLETKQYPFEKRHERGETNLEANEFGEIGKGKTLQQAPENLYVQNQDQEHFGESSKIGKEGVKIAEDPPTKLVATSKTVGSRTKLFESSNLKGSEKDKEDIVGISAYNLSFANVGKGSLSLGTTEVFEVMNADTIVDEILDDETQALEVDCVSEKAIEDDDPRNAENSGEAVEEACLPNEINRHSMNKRDDARTPKASSSYCGLKRTRLLGKRSKKVVSDANETVQDLVIVGSDPTTSGCTKTGKQKNVSSNGKSKKILKCSKEAEKENKPVKNAVQGKTKGTLQVRKKPTGTLIEVGSKQPVWFIFSGHRSERQKFRQIVRNLNGRFCRDSHNWSYQATHFIAPDPLRRTEKFFAAAASGRWILKKDYLTASSEAGQFLDEESYEWHLNGLSEDGAINLEAPRKWRLLAERTGHGAFHDMRIIVHGECITPPLDTLKRVVKAGGGTILATSPPYSRFLNSEVDFAVVSPGMPRVDIWVQEFLNHEIPCVAADYLVEYVCKVGYPLDKHVLYNTQTWASKSFARLQTKAEEILEEK